MEIELQNVGTAQKNDPPLAPVGPYLHGQQGLFNRRDRENPIFAAMMLPNAGVADALPVFNGARYLDGNFGGTDWAFDSLITGQTAGDLDSFANQPTQPCDDGPVAGLLKFCSIANTSGNYRMSTREVQQYRAGRVSDAVDAMTVQVANMLPRAVFGTPSATPSLDNAVSNELAMRIWEMVTGFSRMFYPRVFTGSPANNVGEARDIVGLDIHINSGNKIDASQQTTCTAANSDVKNFGSSVVGATGGRDIMQYIEMCDAFVMDKARRQGLGTPEYIIAMRPEMLYSISQVVPVQKYQQVIAYINNVTNGRVTLNGNDLLTERNAIRSSLLLPVNGRMLRIVVDDTIAEVSSIPGGIPTYASTIYGIPLTVMGGYPVTFWEYFNHDNGQDRAIQQYANGLTWTTDGGMFRWFSDFSKGCLKLNVQFTPRLRMRTPQIAWRIDSVAVQPLQHFSSYSPDSAYFTNGGVTQGDSQKYYSSWSSDSPALP